MSKKILVIEDWEKFLGEIRSRFGVSDKVIIRNYILEKFEDCELKDVIEFEALAIKYSPPSEGYLRVLPLDPMKLPKDKFKDNDKLQVFVVRPKKPEVKDEVQN